MKIYFTRKLFKIFFVSNNESINNVDRKILYKNKCFWCVGFLAPPNTDLVGYHTYIDEVMPPESPYLYGLHPNAEIGFLTTTSENLFKTVFEMQPRDAGSCGGQTITREEKASHRITSFTF